MEGSWRERSESQILRYGQIGRGQDDRAISCQMKGDLPSACCNIRNARIRGQRWDVWVQMESKGVLPEIILVVKPMMRSWSVSRAWH